MIYGEMATTVRRDGIDATAEVSDRVTVEIQRNVANSDQRTVYIHVNGITVVRMGHILHSNLGVIFQEGLAKNLKRSRTWQPRSYLPRGIN